VAVSAIVSAAAAVILTIATIVLAAFTYFLWKATKQAVGETTEALDVAQRQFLLMGRQTDIIEKQHAIDRLDYLATHRPRLTVHACDYLAVPTGDGDGRASIGASILCFNTGTNRARAVEARGEILVTWNLAVDVQRPLVGEFADVHGGTKLRFSVVSERALTDLVGDTPPAQCVGTLVYWDDSDVRRETGFCFILRLTHPPSWTSANSPEHEYEY
jgi:hypothetical protein